MIFALSPDLPAAAWYRCQKNIFTGNRCHLLRGQCLSKYMADQPFLFASAVDIENELSLVR